MDKKFKKIVATGLAVTSLATAGGVAAKKIDKKINEREYTIEAGDTLYDISNKVYGSTIYFDDIAAYNNIEDPNDIKAGDVIILPKRLNDKVQTVETKDQTYTIGKGDSLSSICSRYYNDNSLGTALRLAAYNNIENPDLIKAGQVINIPSYDELLKVNPYPYDYEIDNGMKK